MTIIVVVLLSLIIIEEIAEYLFKKTKNYRSQLSGADKLFSVPDNIEICNVGSGPGMYAISYDNYEKQGFNFSTSPQSFSYSFKLLKHFSSRIKKNAIIIIIIMCPLSFGANNAYKRKNYSDKFYGVLPAKDIDNYSFTRAIINYHPLLVRLLSRIKRRFCLLNGSTDKIAVKNNSVVYSWKNQFDLYDLKDETQKEKHTQAFEEKINVLNDMVKYCHNKDWNPVFVIPPVPEETRNYISDEFAKAFVFDNIEKVKKIYPDLKVYSYYNDERFTSDMFMNDIFMNEKGKSFFSSILFDDLN